MIDLRVVVAGCAMGILVASGLNVLSERPTSKISLSSAFKKLGSVVAQPSFVETALAADQDALDRLILIKNLYFFVNGGVRS
jgi:hypothetical protein